MRREFLTLVLSVPILLGFGVRIADGGRPFREKDPAAVSSVVLEASSPRRTFSNLRLVPSHEPTMIEPWIHSKMPPGVKEKLRTALQIAAQRINEVSRCGELFRRLGAEGIEVLTTTLYFPVSSHKRESKLCRRNVAYSVVGGSPTWLCRDFARLSDKRAAMFVIHEALHHAGLTEKPNDLNGMTSRAINGMVSRDCEL